MTRYFCGWKHYEPCSRGYCVRGECPAPMEEHNAPVDNSDHPGQTTRLSILCAECGAEWTESSTSEC